MGFGYVQTPGTVQLILDLDLETDVGDALALGCAHNLMDNGECNLLGVALCGTYADSPYCADAINTYHRHPQVPVGVNMGSEIEPGPLLDTPYSTAIKNRFPRYRTSFEDATTMYRRLLAAQADDSAVICAIGFLSNLSALLDSEADEYSDLSGIDLVARKVRLVCAMAGDYPTGHEYNIYVDIPSAQNFVANCPVPIEFTGFTQGELVQVGADVESLVPTTSPLRVAHDIFVAEYGGPNRAAWDQLGLIHAVRGYASHWTRSAAGTNSVDGGGNNSFNAGAGQHYYLTNATSAPALVDVVEALQTQAPSGGFH